jgi:NTE family protein
VFPPVPIGERSLVDGGVANNTPLSHAVALGAQRIFVLPTRDPQRPADGTSRGALQAAIDGLAVLADARLEFDLAKYSRNAEIIMLPCPNRLHLRPTDFDHANQLIHDAFIATRALLARVQRRRSRSAQPGRRRGARRPPNSAHDLLQAA